MRGRRKFNEGDKSERPKKKIGPAPVDKAVNHVDSPTSLKTQCKKYFHSMERSSDSISSLINQDRQGLKVGGIDPRPQESCTRVESSQHAVLNHPPCNGGTIISETRKIGPRNDETRLNRSKFQDLDMHEWLSQLQVSTNEIDFSQDVSRLNQSQFLESLQNSNFSTQLSNAPASQYMAPIEIRVENCSMSVASVAGSSSVQGTSVTPMILRKIPLYVLTPLELESSDSQKRAIQSLQEVISGLTGGYLPPVSYLGHNPPDDNVADSGSIKTAPCAGVSTEVDTFEDLLMKNPWLGGDSMLLQSPRVGVSNNMDSFPDFSDILSPRFEMDGEDLKLLFGEIDGNETNDNNLAQSKMVDDLKKQGSPTRSVSEQPKVDKSLDSTQLLLELQKDVEEDLTRARDGTHFLLEPSPRISAMRKVPLSLDSRLSACRLTGPVKVIREKVESEEDLFQRPDCVSIFKAESGEKMAFQCAVTREAPLKEASADIEMANGISAAEICSRFGLTISSNAVDEREENCEVKRDRSGSTEAPGKSLSAIRKKKQRSQTVGSGNLRGRSLTLDPLRLEACSSFLVAFDSDCLLQEIQEPEFNVSEFLSTELIALANDKTCSEFGRSLLLTYLEFASNGHPNQTAGFWFGMDVDPRMRTFLRKLEQLKKRFVQVTEKTLENPIRKLVKAFQSKQKQFLPFFKFYEPGLPPFQKLQSQAMSALRVSFLTAVKTLMSQTQPRTHEGQEVSRSQAGPSPSHPLGTLSASEANQSPPNSASNPALHTMNLAERSPLFSSDNDCARLVGSRRDMGLSGARGELPQAAAAFMRSWLIDHWDRPYPSRQAKLKLAMDCGINVKQVEDWMVNARARLWKPLTLEMVQELQKGSL